MNRVLSARVLHNPSLVTDTQQTVAASRRMLRTCQRRRCVTLNPIAVLSHRFKLPIGLRFSFSAPKNSTNLKKEIMTTHTGSCHCGAIAFDVDGEIDSGLACNCSICSRRASLLWFVPRTALRLKTPESDASTYTFNKHVIKHCFCAKCGIHTFGEGTDPKGNAIAAVNLRCIENLDLSKVPVNEFDGKSK